MESGSVQNLHINDSMSFEPNIPRAIKRVMQYCGNHARFDIVLLLAFFEMSPPTLVLIAFGIYFAATLLELHLTFEICCLGLSLYTQRDL